MAKPQKKKSIATRKSFVTQKLDFRWPSLIAIIAFGLYFNTLHHEYAFDDSIAIINNQLVQQGFDGIGGLLKVDFWHFYNLSLGYYRPLSLITFAIEHQFFGSAPHISHLINILLYAFTGFILCLLLVELFAGYHKLFTFLICVLFIAHPAHTEVVANLKSRDEILSFLGVISMLFIMFRFDGSQKKKYLIISLVIYYLAMLSKETAITGVVLLPAVLYFFRDRSIGESIKKAVPFALVVLLFYFQKYAVLGNASEKIFYELNNYPYIHSKFPSSMVIFFYCLKLLVFPHPLVYNYSYNLIPSGSFSNPLTWLGFALFCVLLYFAVKGFMKKSIWGFALAVFFTTLLPALAFVWLRGGIMAERFLYAPSLAFSIAVVYFLFMFLKSKESSAKPSGQLLSPSIIAICAVVFVAYSFKTIDRNKAWKDNMTLYSTDIAYASNSCQTDRHYGHEVLEKCIAEKDTAKKSALFRESLQYLHKAVSINPRFGEVYDDLGRAYYDVRFTPDSAIYFFRMGIDVTPGQAINYSNLALVYQTIQQFKLASFYYNLAAYINPGFVDARQSADQLKKEKGLDVREYPGGENPALSNLQLPVLTVPGSNL